MMTDLFAVVVIALTIVVAYHTGTEGRRGRRWGRY